MMIQCQECGNYISDQAYSCPHCGFPLVDIGYDYEEGARESRTDYAQSKVKTHKMTKLMWFMICVLMFFVAYGMGHSLFPKAVNGGGSFVPIGIAIASGIYLFASLSMALWKRLLLGILPNSFLIYMIFTSFSGGYLLGCIMGM